MCVLGAAFLRERCLAIRALGWTKSAKDFRRNCADSAAGSVAWGRAGSFGAATGLRYQRGFRYRRDRRVQGDGWRRRSKGDGWNSDGIGYRLTGDERSQEDARKIWHPL